MKAIASVFTLQSIKSRIETVPSISVSDSYISFLLYSPLNQGLKQEYTGEKYWQYVGFLLYSPLNQGLKPYIQSSSECLVGVFTLQSIKSRIETTSAIWINYK